MCGIAEAGLALSAFSTVQKMQADSDQANYTAGVARNNAQIARNNATAAEYAATDAQRRGDLEAQRVARQTSQMIGSQRASYAAKGVDISDGTPADIIDQANFFGNVDSATARYNGKMDAYGKRVNAQNFNSQASGYDSAASAADYNGRQAATGDLLSGAGSVSAGWYSYGLNKKYKIG